MSGLRLVFLKKQSGVGLGWFKVRDKISREKRIQQLEDIYTTIHRRLGT